MINSVINAVIFLPTMLIVAGLCAYGALYLCAFALGFGGSPAKGLKVGKTAQEKLFNKIKKGGK